MPTSLFGRDIFLPNGTDYQQSAITFDTYMARSKKKKVINTNYYRAIPGETTWDFPEGREKKSSQAHKIFFLC
jgi:hypothetical protein